MLPAAAVRAQGTAAAQQRYAASRASQQASAPYRDVLALEVDDGDVLVTQLAPRQARQHPRRGAVWEYRRAGGGGLFHRGAWVPALMCKRGRLAAAGRQEPSRLAGAEMQDDRVACLPAALLPHLILLSHFQPVGMIG